MSNDALATCVRDCDVFARVMPEQKLRIVNALKSNGEIVVMTGDGVNDAPSLKAADIGVAMGGRGTDVAREAAAVVLLDDNFSSIVGAIRLGRRIYDNLRKAMSYILAVHVPIAGIAVLPLLTGWPIILQPIHIAFLEMVIDPVCSIVFEAEREEENIMSRPPRAKTSPLLPKPLILWSVAQGILAFACVGAIFALAQQRRMPTEEVRALTFLALVQANIVLIFSNRSFKNSILSWITERNGVLRIAIGGVIVALSVILSWPGAWLAFHFGPLHLDDLAITLAVSLVLLALLNLLKRYFHDRLTS